MTSEATVADALAALEARGYTERLEAVDGGLRAAQWTAPRPPAELALDDAIRVEYDTDPADEVLVLAIRDPDTGARGTYVVAYGPAADPRDAAIVEALARPTA
ncbi:MAG: hypothetical protein D6689_02265 [Deltaproteobacteria bacterium]|nr:MAG: hypothetical protein D6689_02265 [Deltaproteobacteria bacterium]